MTSVPVIDVSGLRGTLAQRQSVARAIGDACERIGFFCIKGHGVAPTLTEEVSRAAKEFFRLPEAEKERIARKPPYFRGYVGMGTEGLGRTLGYGGVADLKEAFSMGPVEVPDGLYYTNADAAPHFAPNRWPDRPARFRPIFERYYLTMAMLAAQLVSGFALALDLPEDWFADKIDRHISNIRANFYPAQAHPAPQGQLRAGAHTDYGTVTILLTEDAPGGLQVRGVSDQWIDIPHRPDHFVVNIGDLMAQWTNDRFVSTMHRVVNPPTGDRTDRLSIAFFQQPNYDALVECLPTCLRPGDVPRHQPITSGAHRYLKLNRAKTASVA